MPSTALMRVGLVGSLIWLAGCGAGSGGGEPRGPIDPELAAQGEALFQSKGCTACHTLGGGRLVGPDLAGLTERRSFSFVQGMILNPDSMLANNDTAKALLAEYFTPMTSQGLSAEEARALFELFRRHDASHNGGQGGQ